VELFTWRGVLTRLREAEGVRSGDT